MLTHLQIRDFAIVETLELEFFSGMSAITGETGAGKSIMVDALGLLLGDRADSDVVRHGAERAEIAASFDLSSLPQAQAWLSEHDLTPAAGGECHLRRLINHNGRSRAYINGVSQPLQMLKALGELLVDIHSQHEHQSLLKRDLQRELLDDYADHKQNLTKLERCFRYWQQLQQQLRALEKADRERDARLDLLKFQTEELNTVALTDGEFTNLESEYKRLTNAGQILTAGQNALDQLFDNEELSAHGLIGKVLAELKDLSAVDKTLNSTTELLNNALIQIDEARAELNHYLQNVELDPERLNWVEQRLDAILKLARKHRLQPDQLLDKHTELETELDSLLSTEQRRDTLQQDIEKALNDYQKLAIKVGKQRRKAATKLAKQISAAMQQLGMLGGRFQVDFTTYNKPAIYGLEGVEFTVSANPGQPLKPLTRVASGGELSRISLAIQVIAANSAHIPTLIFDEVDSGVGGAVAEVVGQQLRRLGDSRQVLCVTHLAQVAVQAHQQYRVSKDTQAKQTQTAISALDNSQRIEEIARMLGGVKLTKRTLAHAREMINSAQTEN